MAASDYRIKEGFNVALASLTKFTPQCQSAGVKATRRDFSANGSVKDWGLYVELTWSALPLSQYTGILTAAGLDDNLATGVTVYCRDDTYIYRRYNGVAVRPPASWQNARARNVVLLVRDLELAT